MAYTEPGIKLAQDFEAAVAAGAAPLYAAIVGPAYRLSRFDSVDVNGENALLGVYTRTTPSVELAWPDHVTGNAVDLATARVMIKDGKLRYYNGTDDATMVAEDGYVLTSSLVFASNSVADRTAAAFGERDVAIGDIIRMTWVDGDDVTQQFESVITDILAATVAGTTAPVPTKPVGKLATVEGSTEIVATPAGLTTSYDVTTYDNLAGGWPSDTFTIRVVTKGTGGDLYYGLDGTTLEITAAGAGTVQTVILGTTVLYDSGTDTYIVDLGSNGAKMSIANDDGTFSINDTWSVQVRMDFTPVDVATPAKLDILGTYTGTKNTQYILTAISGGTVGGTTQPVFSFRTSNSAPGETTGTITVAGAATYAFGNLGMSLVLGADVQICAGDVVVFDVVGVTAGALTKLEVADSVPCTTGIDISIDLFATYTGEFPADYTTLAADSITIFGNAVMESTLLGDATTVALFDGVLYADYRELNTALSLAVSSLADIGEVEAAVGPVSALNPLGKGLYMALQNANGQDVYYVGVESDDLSGYLAALDLLSNNDVIHGLAICTNDLEIQNAIKAHALELSGETICRWRVAWLGNNAQDVTAILGSDAGLTATVAEYGTDLYRLATVDGADLVVEGVRAGDVLRINIAEDGTYDEYTIDRVVDSETLLLADSLPAPVAVALDVEIWRTLTSAEFAEEIAAYSGGFQHRRVRCLYADGLQEADGTAMDTCYLGCALTGLRSGSAPHAPLTRVSLTGVYMQPTHKFSRTQLNTMAAGGTWVITKDDITGAITTRHQITTDMTGIDYREDTITCNVDHFSRAILASIADLIGRSNVSTGLLGLIRQRLQSVISQVGSYPYPISLGPQIQGATITTLKRDDVLRDSVIIGITPEWPYPLNNAEIRIRVSAAG